MAPDADRRRIQVLVADERGRRLRAASISRWLARVAPARARGTVSHFLGDIVIARGVAKRQARDAGHSEATELRVLALHGLLHLLGYDHARDRGEMQRLERRLRRKGGV